MGTHYIRALFLELMDKAENIPIVMTLLTDYGLVDNPVYDSTETPTAFIKNSSAKEDVYAAVKKKEPIQKEDSSCVYAEVDKTSKTGKKRTAAEKHQKNSKGEIYENVELKGKISSPEDLYENSKSTKTGSTVDNVYENPAHKGYMVNTDGLLYADLALNPSKTRNGKPVIIGEENRTVYAKIAYGKRGEPLPD